MFTTEGLFQNQVQFLCRVHLETVQMFFLIFIFLRVEPFCGGVSGEGAAASFLSVPSLRANLTHPNDH